MSIEAKDRAALDAAMERYLGALNALDETQFVACFRENCLLRDPYGVILYEGHNGVHDYFRTMRDTWQTFHIQPGRVYYGGSERVAFTWEVTATAHNGKSAHFDGIAVMTLEGLLIDGLESYWDAAAMFEQIKE